MASEEWSWEECPANLRFFRGRVSKFLLGIENPQKWFIPREARAEG